MSLPVLILLATLAPSAAQERRSLTPEDAPVQGIVVDRILDQPVARTRIQLSGGTRSELVWTDEAGMFTSELRYPRGKVWVRSWDNGDQTQVRPSFCIVDHEPDAGRAARATCRLDVGARYELDLGLPGGAALTELEVATWPRAQQPDRPAWRGHPLQLHVDGGQWIRVPSTFRFGAHTTTLFVGTRDGLHGVRIELPEPSKVSAGTLAAQLVPYAAARVLVRSSQGPAPDRRGVTLLFRPLGGKPRSAFQTRAFLDHELRVPWVEPGRWEIEASSPRFTSRKVTLELEAGRESRATLLLGEPLALGTLRVQVADPDGDVEGWEDRRHAPRLSAWVTCPQAALRLRAKADRGNGICGQDDMGLDAWFERVERDGRFVYEVVFENVPRLECQVALWSDRLVDPWVQSARPGETVRFEYQREDPDQAYGFRVTLADTGERSRSYQISPVRPEVGYPPVNFPFATHVRKSHVLRYDLPDEPLEWCVWQNGYRRVYGDRDAFLPDPPQAGHWARVTLEPGFGVRLRALDVAGNALAGVGVEFDGKVFVTGADGCVELSSKARSPDPRLRVPGHEIVAGNVPPTGIFEAHLPLLQLVLR